MNLTYHMTVTRWPDGTFQGRPYVIAATDGSFVAEGFRNEVCVARLTELVDAANQCAELKARQADLRAVLDRILRCPEAEIVHELAKAALARTNPLP